MDTDADTAGGESRALDDPTDWPTRDWPMCGHVERRARRLNDMIDRIGANRSRLVRACGGATIAEASQNCLTCPYPTACIEWVADKSFDAIEPPAFCRNRNLIQRCRAAESVRGGDGAGDAETPHEPRIKR